MIKIMSAITDMPVIDTLGDLEHYNFFGSMKFYTLVILLAYFFEMNKTGTALFIITLFSGIILSLIYIITLYLTGGVYKPSVTTGLATTFFLVLMHKRSVWLFTVLAVFVLSMVHLCKILDDYTVDISNTLINIFSGTILGSVLFASSRAFIPK